MSDPVPNPQVAETNIEQLVGDIAGGAGIMIASLYEAIAMAQAGDTVGLIYALRRSRAYWHSISESAAELVSADAERLSCLRQKEGDK
jgi:hypothetical protein